MNKKDTSFSDILKSGFTLVELLIVVSILALLTVAVLAAINPIEQLKKGRDTQRKSDAATYLAAQERFLSSFGCYSWLFDGSTCTSGLFPGIQNGTNKSTIVPGSFSGTYGWSSALLDDDEIKAQFISRSTITKGELNISHDPVAGQISVCFTPESKSARNGALGPIVNNANQTTGADCSGLYSATDVNCKVCVPQ